MQALASLAGLPSRQADEEGIDRAMYFVALEGVTRYALGEAVKAVMRNRLNHTFFPSPVELRRLCDEAQRPHNDYQRRIRETEAQRKEREEFDRIQARKNPESLARSKALWESVRNTMGPDKPEEPRPLLDPELVAKVPDAPSTFKRAPKVA